MFMPISNSSEMRRSFDAVLTQRAKLPLWSVLGSGEGNAGAAKEAQSMALPLGHGDAAGQTIESGKVPGSLTDCHGRRAAKNVLGAMPVRRVRVAAPDGGGGPRRSTHSDGSHASPGEGLDVTTATDPAKASAHPFGIGGSALAHGPRGG
jgi:hypothetical protein